MQIFFINSIKMSRYIVALFSSLVFSAISVSGNERDASLLDRSRVHPRSIKPFGNNGGVLLGGMGSPAEWTLSKANLVAEFFTSEPAPHNNVDRLDRSPKSIFSFFTGNLSNGSNARSAYVPSDSLPDHMLPPPPPTKSQERPDKVGNLVVSETNYNPHTVPLDANRNAANILLGRGYAAPFRPVNQVQQFVTPNSPTSGYPHNIRPPRGPPPPPTRQYIWDGFRQITGLRPPLPVPVHQQQYQQQPPSLYLPPQNPQSTPPQGPAPSPIPISHGQQQPQTQNPAPPAQVQYHAPAPRNITGFTPSPQYLPPQNPINQNGPPQVNDFQPVSPPPQILDNYRKQVVYPLPGPEQYSTEKPLVYVLANSSFDQSTTQNPANFQYHSQGSTGGLNTYTQYENESVPPPPVSSSLVQALQKGQPTPVSNPQPEQPQQNGGPVQISDHNALALTEPLSHVLAEANAKAGEAMDKTIRFVIHKPEDEDIVKNAILEDAQNRYEDVKFVQGPTLKVQRKETVYLPPKKKTVVYILLKEPQIDTDVEVMSPAEDEPVPEVYITYQKSDGAVKTKHYSPKPIRQEDMKKYLDVEEEDLYATGEESRIHPRFSKSTSVSLSTSSKVSRKTASTSMSIPSANETNNASNPSPSFTSKNNSSSPADIKRSPLLYTSRGLEQVQISNSTSSVRLPVKKPRSSDFENLAASPRRVSRSRHYPLKCPTTVT